LGSAPDDPTSFDERLYYYTLDLDYGIQSYVFKGSQEELEHVPFDTLSADEKEVYYLFLYIIFFNDEYKIKLNDKNLERLIKDGTYYYEYFFQIQELFGVR
jgi:hypothetical protein